MHFKSLISALLVPFCANAENVDVYLLGGQSNMQGLGLVAELSAEEKAPNPKISFWNGTAFEPLVPGKTKTSDRIGEFGPEIGFAKSLPVQGPAHLIKYNASGMPLDAGWNGGQWIGGQAPGRTNFFPGQNPDDTNKGKLYQAMIARFRAGMDSIRKRGDTPVIKGFLWMQGEQDSKQETSAKNYAANLKLLRDRLAQDLAIPVLPIVFGQVLPYPTPLPRFTFRNEIRAQMAASDMDSGKPSALSHCRMVSTDGYPLKDDTVHYNTRGQIMLGTAMAKGLTEASKGPVTP